MITGYYIQIAVQMDLKCRQERLVFVDPEDEEISYWWPAILVPEEEYELFKETMDNDAGVNVGDHERLVCYFEDGSFSVVPKSGLIPFNPQREPYKSYSTRLKNFLTDAGVRRATGFYNSAETGYLDPTTESEFDEVEVEAGGLLTEEEIVEEVVKEEQTPTPMPIATIPVKKVKMSKEPPGGTAVVKNKRGRKPKNQTEILVSPKPMNPSDMMKIEALISSKLSSESISKIPTEI